MKNIISNKDHILINEAIEDLEKASTGEILTFITRQSSKYILFRFAYAYFISLILLVLFFNYFLFALNDKYLNLVFGIYVLTFILFYYIFKFNFLLKYLIPNNVKKHKCEKQASFEFFNNGVYKTKEKTGILIYISILEKEVIIIGDEGINLKIPNNSWSNLINIIIKGIKEKSLAKGIIDGLRASNELLKNNFPPSGEYINEIKQSLIIKS